MTTRTQTCHLIFPTDESEAQVIPRHSLHTVEAPRQVNDDAKRRIEDSHREMQHQTREVEGLRMQLLRMGANALPSPATRVTLTLLEAGESVFQKQCLNFPALRGAQPLFHALFGVRTLSGTLLDPTFNQ